MDRGENRFGSLLQGVLSTFKDAQGTTDTAALNAVVEVHRKVRVLNLSWYQRVGRLYVGMARTRNFLFFLQYFEQKPYSFTTNTLKAYLSAQPFSLSAFLISKTHIVVQKPHRRQLNAKVCGSKSAIYAILSFFLLSPLCSTMISWELFKYSPSFSTKLMLITAWSSTTTQRLKFSLVNKTHSQRSVTRGGWTWLNITN